MLPIPPPPIRACFTWYEAAERDRTRRRPVTTGPARAAATIAAALLEVEAGARPGRQLERLCHPTLWEALDRRLSRRGGPPISGHSLRRVLIQEQEPGLVDAVALLQRGGRLEPVAMRLENVAGRWQLTELQYVPAGNPPDHAGVVA